MKTFNILLLAFFLLIPGAINAQIGIGIANPAASAQLDVTSNTKGFLPPRMTQTERNAIANPVAGLMIWCKDCGVLGEIQVYNGGAWSNMTGGYPALPIPSSVTIGTQEWMTRNLDVVTYRNGDTIPQVTDTAIWNNLTTGAWCYYNNDPALGVVYGKLYNRYAVVDIRGLAPMGWHIPVNAEWDILSDNLGGSLAAGGKMRATTLWSIPNTGVNNESGFTALPGGIRFNDGSFNLIGNQGYWWSPDSSEQYDPITNSAIERNFSYSLGSADSFDRNFLTVRLSTAKPDPNKPGSYIYNIIENPLKQGISVRCLKD